MAKTNNLKDFLTDIADAIREKEGTTDLINPQEFSARVRALEIGSGEGQEQEDPMPKPEHYVPFYVEALENVTIAFSNPYEYSKDSITWHSATSNTSVSAQASERVYYKASGLTATSTSGIGKFTISGNCNIGGNLMSMIYKDDFVDKLTLTQTHSFYGMFAGQKTIIDASRLSLPATTLTDSCYYSMFDGCSQLTKAPALPATALAQKCYVKMFNSCKSLVTAPALPATNLTTSCYNNMFAYCSSLLNAPKLNAMIMGDTCYSNMFHSCASLVKAPALPATTLNTYCYNNMFIYCYNLEEAPVLPALTLKENCYRNMFQHCNKITFIKAMFLTTPGDAYTDTWVRGVATVGTFVKNAAATWEISGEDGTPSGWTIEYAQQ